MTSLRETAAPPSRRYPTPTSAAAAGRAALHHPWTSLIVLALLVKVLLITLTLVAFGAAPDPISALARTWDQWDAQHYLYLATHGYAASGDARNLIAFFPLYPALIGAVAATGLGARVAALLISNVAGVLAAIALYEVARQDDEERAAWRAAAFFTVFPTAYFLLVGYTEALFCALAFSAVLLARRRNWVGAGMVGGLAAAARLTGSALLPFLVVEALASRQVRRSLSQVALGASLIGLGFAVYLATNQLVLGDAFAFVAVQREHWAHRLSAPWVGFASAMRSLGWRVPWEKLTVGAGEMVGGVTSYATAALSWIRLRPSDAVYATVVTVMVTFVPFWLSIPRYLLAMYPLFLLVGRIGSRWLYLALVITSLLGLVVFGLAFGLGYWAF